MGSTVEGEEVGGLVGAFEGECNQDGVGGGEQVVWF